MKGIPQGRYTKGFREEAVKLVTEEKLSLPEAARRLTSDVNSAHLTTPGADGFTPTIDYCDLNMAL
ncbi:hypothetical protein ACFLWY_04125 [Chloroflexota bacterium]